MITIRPMTIADLPLGLKLARQAGWNQIESDWLRFLGMQPDGCFVGELDEEAVATTAAFIFDDVAWLAMVLVEINARRKGVATALLKHALEFLDKQGVQTVRLDATAAGQPVYEKLGFVPEYQLTRYQGIAPQVEPQPRVMGAGRGSFGEIIVFDRRMTGTSREKMLTRLFEESPQGARVVYRNDRLEGYASVRSGANATLIGPCIATDQAGAALLRDALGHCAGRPVFIDVPRDNAPVLAIAETSGLKVQRHFTRMCRGRRLQDNVAAIWASSGPEKG